MNKLLNIIKEKLDLSEEDIKAKLEINDQELTDKLLKEKLGIYSFYINKKDNEAYILKKLDNKQKEIEALKEIERNFSSLSDNHLLLKNKFQELLKNEWKNISNDNLPETKIEEIDFNNLKQSLLKIADNNNLSIIDNQSSIADITKQKTNNEMTKIIEELVF